MDRKPDPSPKKEDQGSGNNSSSNRRNQGSRNKGNRPRFEGREENLKGHIYDYTGERAPDKYIKTTKELITHVGKFSSKYVSDFTTAIRKLELEDPVPPEEPSETTNFAFE